MASGRRIQSIISPTRSLTPTKPFTKQRIHLKATEDAPLRELRSKSVPRPINLLYSPAVVPNYQEREIFLLTRNSRKVKAEDNIANRARDQLHWTFIPHTSKEHLRTVCARNHYKRRWSTAFATALKQNGFDFHGRRLPADPGQLKETGLKGTLEVRLYQAPNLGDTDQSGMLRHSDSIVKVLMEKQQLSQQLPGARSPRFKKHN